MFVANGRRELMTAGTTVTPFLALGDGKRAIDDAELEQHLERVADSLVEDGAKRILLVPPDHTRLYSRGGPIAVHLDRALRKRGAEVSIMPALGTHRPLTAEQCRLLFHDAIGVERLLEHRWRDGLATPGELAPEEVSAAAGRDLELSLPLMVNSALVDGRFDLVIAVGQVVPHEVAGFGGYTKHVCIGLGGRETIHRRSTAPCKPPGMP